MVKLFNLYTFTLSINQNNNKMTYQNPKHAFNAAIKSGRLSENPKNPYYAGNYMYMGTNDNDIDLFKHIDTRIYLAEKHIEFFNEPIN